MRTALVAAILLSAVAHAQAPSRALLDEASQLHQQAQRDHDKAKYERAHQLYQQYLAGNRDDADASTSFFDAELLFRLERYDEAATMYERVTTLAPKGKHTDEAAYGFVIAAKNAVKSDNGSQGKPPCPEPKPCPIPADQQRLLAAFDRYLQVTAKSADRPNIEYRRARVFYERNHFAEAAQQFDHVFTTYPDHELATYSANLEMDCLAILKRYDELRALVERVKKSPSMADEVTQKQVRDNDAALKKRGK